MTPGSHNLLLCILLVALAGQPRTVIDMQEFRVFFPSGGAALDEDATRNINRVVELHQGGCSNQTLYLYGYTDTMGTTEANIKRAATYTDVVAKALVVSGVPASKIVQRPVGESDMLHETPDETDEILNRNVHISFGERDGFEACDFKLVF
jgi:outer membrane protein OmpA-like peptidoglycan-associated protein